MSEIYSQMIGLVGENNDVYTEWWLKTKLQKNMESILCSLKLLGNQRLRLNLL